MSRSAVICAWAAALLAASVHAQLAPPLTGPAQSSRELAAQALPPGGMFAYKARLIELVKLKRHDVLHQHFEERLRDIKREGASDQGGRYMFTMVGGVDEANARVFDEWADAHPQSYIGPLARASFNFHRGWEARGNKMARETSASQFAELDRWLMLVRRDVQLALQREPGCALCYSVLIELSMPLSLHKETQEWFTLGIGIDRDSIAVPLAYYHALDRRWGGSVDQQSALADKLKLAGHERAARRLSAQLLADRIDVASWQTPADVSAGLTAARASLAIADTFDGNYALAYALQKQGQHAEANDQFARLVEQYDGGAKVFEARAYSHARLKQWPEAIRDLRIGYENFLSPWSFEMLVRLSAGNSGWDFRTRPADTPELCKEGALRGLAIAMTCLGGMHFFATGGVKADHVAARQWFRRAAEAGDPQGMMDYAQMCRNGQGGAADQAQAIRWWIAAARLNHPQAQQKLNSEVGLLDRLTYIHWPQIEAGTRGWLRWIARLVEYVFTK